MDNASALQAVGLIFACIIAMILYLEGKHTSSKGWKIMASIAAIMGAPGLIHMLYVMYGSIL